MPIIETMEQLTPEWFAARLGNPGASSFNKIITSTGKPSTSSKDYMYQLAGEFVRGEAEIFEPTIHMQNGIEREAKARLSFEMETGLDVEQVGIVFTDDRRAHCSPDGLLGDDAGYEVKCPMIKTHTKYLLSGKIPAEYVPQVQGSLYISERDKWYFHSWYDGLPSLIIEVGRDDEYIKKLADALDRFCDELAQTIENLKKL